VPQAALTPLGAVELSSETEAYDSLEVLPEIFGRLLRPYLGRRATSRVRVALGLPTMQVFFSTRAAQATDRDVNPATLLHEVFRSSDVKADEMQVDLMRGQPGKRPFASLVACRRKYLCDLLDAMKTCGVRPFRAEPAPFALLRLGATQLRAPRKAAAVIRFFLGPAEGVALLLQGGMPLAWRRFDLPAGSENRALLSTAMALQVVGRRCGESGRPDAVLIHGRLDMAETLRNDMFKTVMGCRPQHTAGPPYDARSIALGLAMGCREADEALDLSRTLKSRAPVWDVLPYGQVAAQVAVLASLSWMLSGHLRDVRAARKVVQSECAAHSWINKVSDDRLQKEKSDLEAKISAVKSFLETRVVWSAYTRNAASRLTESMVLRTFTGSCEFGATGKNAKKSLVLGLSAPIPQGRTMPHEIDAYLGTLRSDETLRRDFPQVELGGLRWANALSGAATPQASFTVNCMPISDKPADKAVAKPADKATAKPKSG
jgi:hypothetical protein